MACHTPPLEKERRKGKHHSIQFKNVEFWDGMGLRLHGMPQSTSVWPETQGHPIHNTNGWGL